MREGPARKSARCLAKEHSGDPWSDANGSTKHLVQRAEVCRTNGTSLSCGAIDFALVSEQRHKAALHIIVLLFVRRAFRGLAKSFERRAA